MKKVICIIGMLLLVETEIRTAPAASSHPVFTAPPGIAKPLEDLVPLVDTLAQQLTHLSEKVETL